MNIQGIDKMSEQTFQFRIIEIYRRRYMVSKLFLFLLLAATAVAQTTTTYTGTIKDLSQQVVTAGQVNFTLSLTTSSTIPGVGTFVPTTTNCNINNDGTLSGYVGGVVSGPCKVTMNTALTPTGTAYRICIQPYFNTPGSCFFDYAITASKDITTVVPTLSTGPINYGGVPGPALNFLGAWSSTTVYQTGQAVAYNNQVYISILGSNLNQIPTSSPTFWAIVVSPASLTAAPNVTQTVTQPSGTTFQANSLNGELNAKLFAGSDIGAKINAAILALPGGCGTILIPAGTYNQTTTILKPRCVKLMGQGDGGTGTVATVLNWTPTTGVAVNVADSSGVSNYPGGGIEDLGFVGPGNGTTSTGLYLGGDLAGVMSATGAYGDHQNFNRIGVTGFGTGVTWGNNSWDDTFHEALINGNGIGIDYSSGVPVNSGESISLVNTSIQNNTLGLKLAGYSDFYITNSRCDYNSKCAQIGGATQAYFNGDHFEQLSGPFITFPGSIDGRGMLSIDGSSLVLAAPTGTDNAMIDVTPGNFASVIIRGSWVLTAHTVTNFVRWASISGSYPASMLRISDIHFPAFSGSVTNIVNTCAFTGCYISDMASFVPAQTVTLANGWAMVAGAGDPPAVSVVKDGNFVHLSGRISPAAATSTLFGTLPVGYQPPFNQHISIEGTNGTAIGACELLVGTDGSLHVQPLSCATTAASLDGVVFRVQ